MLIQNVGNLSCTKMNKAQRCSILHFFYLAQCYDYNWRKVVAIKFIIYNIYWLLNKQYYRPQSNKFNN